MYDTTFLKFSNTCFRTTGDGNCLYNASSLAVVG